jgi:hypothetical protein
VSIVSPATFTMIKDSAPIITFVLGFLTSRLFMTRKERADVSQKWFENSRSLMERQEETFQKYASAITSYLNCEKKDEIDYFISIATAGETYFYQLRIASDAIMSGHVTSSARDNTLIPKIKEATEKTLPEHYEVLNDIAAKKDFRYDGILERRNYASLYSVVEKYGHLVH